MLHKLDMEVLHKINDMLMPWVFRLKIVVFTREDLRWAAQLYVQRYTGKLYLSVGTDPGDEYTSRPQTRADVIRRYLEVIQWAREEGMSNVSILPQMHVLLWGHKKGV
jgi:7-carboxy-7-deazaguanine synthase